MNYAQIRDMDITNGPGIGIALFVSGCTFNCAGCFNPETHDFNYGKPFTTETMDTLYKALDKPYIKRLSILGGEPLHPKNIEAVTRICRVMKQLCPNKKIWLWTGFVFEDLLLREDAQEILTLIDVLVDGQFVQDKKDFTLEYRGSSNQRIIYLKNN